MGNLKSRWSLLKKWQAKPGNVNRISDCRLSASGRNSGAHAWQKVHIAFRKMSLAGLYSDFIIQKTESSALNRNQTCWIIIQKFCLIHGCSFASKWLCAKWESKNAESWLWVQLTNLQWTRTSVRGCSYPVVPPCPSKLFANCKSWSPYNTQVMQFEETASTPTADLKCGLHLVCSFREHLSPWQKKGGRSVLFLALFLSCSSVYESDKTSFEPSTYKSNSSGKSPCHGPRLGEWWNYK